MNELLLKDKSDYQSVYQYCKSSVAEAVIQIRMNNKERGLVNWR